MLKVDGLKHFLNFDLTKDQEKAFQNVETIQIEDVSTMRSSTVDSNFNEADEPGISDEELKKQVEEGTASYGDGEQNVDPFEGISFDAGSKDFTILAGVKIKNPQKMKQGKLALLQ